jgi:hypothetical protein
MFDPDRLLKDTLPSHPRLLFYPSCGTRCIADIMALDCDVFVFADHRARNPRARRRFWNEIEAEGQTMGKPLTLEASTVGTRVFRVGEKLGFLFFRDNNEVLARIRRTLRVVHCFVGINDGCREGGNYECVHSRPFLYSLLSASAADLVYITDHSEYLGSHTRFRPRRYVPVSDDEGYDFSLNSVFVRHRDLARECITDNRRYYVNRINGSSRSTSYLPAFARYRSVWRGGVIAHYDVTRRKRDDVPFNPAESPKTAFYEAAEVTPPLKEKPFG